MERWKCVGISVMSLASLSACGGDDDADDGPGGVLAQAPHCSADADSLAIEGSIDGVTIDDHRAVNINAGLVNIGEPSFDSPFTNLAALEPSQIEVHLKWAQSIFFGQKAPIVSGMVVGPSASSLAGKSYCVKAGEVGFVDGGNEDGAFKFRVTELRAGAACEGESVPADLRGCYQ